MNQEALKIQPLEAQRMAIPIEAALPPLPPHIESPSPLESESLLMRAITLGQKGGHIAATQRPRTRAMVGVSSRVSFDPKYDRASRLRARVLPLVFEKEGKEVLIDWLRQERGEAYQELGWLTQQVAALEAEALINQRLIPQARKARARLTHFLELQACRKAMSEEGR
jgi:hypothetical protein